MMKYHLINKTEVYNGFFKLDTLRLKHQLFAGGWSEEFSREILDRGNAAGVLLFDPRLDQLVLVEQFRAGAIRSDNPWMLEVVAGMIEPNESPDAVVQREAMEESGAQIKALKQIAHYFSSPGGSSEQIWLFIAHIDSSRVADFGGLDAENEDIKVHSITVERAFKWLKSGKIKNAMTIIALQWLMLQRTRKQIFDQ